MAENRQIPLTIQNPHLQLNFQHTRRSIDRPQSHSETRAKLSQILRCTINPSIHSIHAHQTNKKTGNFLPNRACTTTPRENKSSTTRKTNPPPPFPPASIINIPSHRSLPITPTTTYTYTGQQRTPLAINVFFCGEKTALPGTPGLQRGESPALHRPLIAGKLLVNRRPRHTKDWPTRVYIYTLPRRCTSHPTCRDFSAGTHAYTHARTHEPSGYVILLTHREPSASVSR